MGKKNAQVEELKRKRQMLAECDANIERLRQELSAAQARMAIQQKLEAVANAPHSNRGLPEDILVPMFDHYISETSMGIRVLRLVCKGWMDIVNQTSHLWTNIRIDIPRKAAHIKACQKFCEECIQRTGGLPLDLYMDFRPADIPFEEVLYQHLLEPLQELSDDGEYRKEVARWLWKPIRQQPTRFLQDYRDHILKPLVALAGGSQENMVRWRSFELHCAQTERTLFNLHLLGSILRGPTPILRLLEIHNTGKFVTVWPWDNCPFPAMPQLRHLSLTYAHLPIEHCGFNPLLMETLRLPWHTLGSTLACALGCTNLTTWTVCIQHEAEGYEGFVGFEKANLTFPHLRRLEVSAEIPTLFWTAVSFPVLEHLTFLDRYPTTSFVVNGAISLPRVEVVTFTGPLENEPTTMEDVIKAIILSCPSLLKIQALEKYSDAIVMTLGVLKKSGVELTAVLRTLALELKASRNSEGYERSIDVFDTLF